MDTMSWKSTLIIGGPFLCGLIYKFFKNRLDKPLDSNINEVLFYGAMEEKKRNEIGLENLFCIYYVLAHASKTVDVCVPSLDSEIITKCLLNVHQKNGTKIRVVLHKNNQLEKLSTLSGEGIEVKVTQPTEVLEHEFILVDACEDFDDAVAVMGSLDYDTTRVNCNRDYTMLTAEPNVVTNLKKEFERIWNDTPKIGEQ